MRSQGKQGHSAEPVPVSAYDASLKNLNELMEGEVGGGGFAGVSRMLCVGSGLRGGTFGRSARWRFPFSGKWNPPHRVRWNRCLSLPTGSAS